MRGGDAGAARKKGRYADGGVFEEDAEVIAKSKNRSYVLKNMNDFLKNVHILG